MEFLLGKDLIYKDASQFIENLIDLLYSASDKSAAEYNMMGTAAYAALQLQLVRYSRQVLSARRKISVCFLVYLNRSYFYSISNKFIS